MNLRPDMAYFQQCFHELVNTPSPVGYYREFNPVLARYAESFGYSLTFDRRGTPYIILDGEDNNKTVMIGAHSDTVGFVVRRVDADGKIRVRQLGGINFASVEGETVTIHTRDGRSHTGLFACQSHSVHVFDDAKSLERNENTVMILLDQKISSKEQVYALGIRNGDPISVEPRDEVTPNGYLKSRFIDNKAAVAACFTMLKYFADTGRKPKYRTILAFPYTEEIGFGGTYVPKEVAEYVAIDIGLIGPDQEGDEYKVSICAKDNAAPYDYDLTSRLMDYAEKAGCDYAVDIFYRYGTDGNAAVRAGNDLRAAAFGMAVYCSHGRERTHMTGLENTVKLLLAYVMDL